MSTSQLTKEGLERKRAKGYLLGNAPYGYKHNDDRTKLIELPEEQKIIAHAVELRKGGMNIAAITRELGFPHQQRVRRMVNRACLNFPED